MSETIHDIVSRNSTVIEMVTIAANPRYDIPVNPSIDIATITADDNDPKFVNVEILRSDVTSGNGRRYNADTVRQVSAMIPGVHGFFGHPDPAKFGFEFREPQCIYVGSMVDEMEDGHVRAIAKAYLFKTSNLREWIPKSIAANNPMTVSINGRGDIVRRGDYVDVMNMNVLESIDWANPGTEGIGTSRAISVVKEMRENTKTGGNNMDDVKSIIGNVTVTELKAYNPSAFKGMVESVSLTELREHNPNLVKAIEDAAKITEMKLTVGGVEKSVSLTEIQGIVGGLETKVTEFTAKEAKDKLDKFKSEKIIELVPENLREQVAKRVSGTDEASITESINGELTYIREMTGGVNNPVGRTGRSAPDDMKSAMASLFGHKVEDKK